MEVSKVPAEFQPDADLLQQVIALGIPAAVAEIALYNTGNCSAEGAINFIYETPKMLDLLAGGSLSDEEDDGSENNTKMVFVVNTALNMGVGKIAAQVGHAAVSLYCAAQQIASAKESIEQWVQYGQKKIVLRGQDHKHLLALETQARDASVPCTLIRDAGHTQIEPGSITVLSLFGTEEQLNAITGKLKLL